VHINAPDPVVEAEANGAAALAGTPALEDCIRIRAYLAQSVLQACKEGGVGGDVFSVVAVAGGEKDAFGVLGGAVAAAATVLDHGPPADIGPGRGPLLLLPQQLLGGQKGWGWTEW